MLSLLSLKNHSISRSYSRGRQLQKVGAAHIQTVEENAANITVTGAVIGSHGDNYFSSVTFDNEDDVLVMANCTCPYGCSLYDMCKHSIALGMQYIAEKPKATMKKKKPANFSSMNERKKKPSNLSSMNERKNQQLTTTPLVRNFLQSQIARYSLQLLDENVYHSIRIEPQLDWGQSGITWRFKLGNTRMYILKDIFEFADNMQQHALASYGKQLSFLHIEEAFAPDSLPLAKFLYQWAIQHRKEYMERKYYYYGYEEVLKKAKDISLTRSERDWFFKYFQGKEVLINHSVLGERNWNVSCDTVTLPLHFEEKRTGLELSLPDFYMIYGEKYQYILNLENNTIRPSLFEAPEVIMDFLDCFIRNNRKIFIEKEDIPIFCRMILPTVEKFFVCEKGTFSPETYSVETPEFEIYLDMPQEDYITFRLEVLYGERSYDVLEQIADLALRDFEKEKEVKQLVSQYCNAYDEGENCYVLSEDTNLLYDLITEGIPAFQQVAEVFISDAIKKLEVKPSPKISVGISMSGNLLELEVTSQEMSHAQLLDILSSYHPKKKFHRLKNGSFINLDPEDFDALLGLKEGLGLSEKDWKQKRIALPTYRALYLDSQLKEKHGLLVKKNKDYKLLLRNMKSIEDNDYEVPAELSNILRKYQEEGFLWMKTIKENGFAGILADDMGLGKTLQVITLLLSEKENNPGKPTLIVCPASLVYNWESELEKFAPQLTKQVITGTAAARKELLHTSGDKDVWITSYDLLRRDIIEYESLSFSGQIIDEAQYIKNHSTQVAKAVKLIRAEYRFALTGTPMENRLSELWSIFDYLMPGFLYPYKKFRTEIETPIVQNADARVLDHLQKMIRPFILRRVKKEVLKDLPDKIEKNAYATMDGEQQKLYDANVKKLQMFLKKQTDEEFKSSKIQILSEITKLRQICCNPALSYEDYKGNSAKTELCMEMIENAIEGDHKILLFSQFTSMLDELAKELDKRGISHFQLTGATSKEKRKQLVEQFNADDTPVFLISLKAGGTGFNLTAADVVIHYDPWWNLAVQNQATDRAHRIGQNNVVTVYKLLMKGTIEENIVRLQEKKSELADQLLNGDGMNQISFSKEELLELLG